MSNELWILGKNSVRKSYSHIPEDMLSRVNNKSIAYYECGLYCKRERTKSKFPAPENWNISARGINLDRKF